MSLIDEADTLTVGNRPPITYANEGRQVWITGPLDGANNADGLSLIKLGVYLPTFRNGTNGVRGDLITSDAANHGGHSSYAGVWINAPVFDQKGSESHAAILGSMEPYVGGGDAYGEMVGIFGAFTANRRGGLVELAELGVTINQPSRSQPLTLEVADNVARASYGTALGATSLWARTGGRGVWIISNGTQAATGVFLQGTMNPAIDYAPVGAGSAILQEQVQGEANARFALFDSGMFMGPGSSGFDATISRSASGVIGFNGAIQLGNFTPAAPPASTVRPYTVKNGSNKMEFRVAWPSGANTLLATEP